MLDMTVAEAHAFIQDVNKRWPFTRLNADDTEKLQHAYNIVEKQRVTIDKPVTCTVQPQGIEDSPF